METNRKNRMIRCNYMSDEDRLLLLELQELLSRERDADKIATLQQQYREVTDRSKQLNECDLAECSELKTHIYDKFRMVNGAGRYHIANQFKEMIRQIDIRMSIIYSEMAMEEQQRKLQKLEGTEPDEKPSKSRVRTSKNKTSWSVSFDDLDF